MFERFVDDQRPARRRSVGVVVTLSVLAHLGLIALLLASAAWQLDKLRPDDTEVTLHVAAGLPAGDAGEEAPHRLEKPRHRIAHDEVQPGAQAVHPDDASDDTSGTGTGTGTGTGGTGGPGGPIGLGQCTGADCSLLDQVGVAPPPVVKPQAPKIVSPNLIEGRRVSGDPQIPAPEPVRQAMARAGQNRAVATVKMCLDTAGAVTTVHVVKSSGYEAYDRKLTDAMRDWRYRPYELEDGTRVAVCTAVTFIYVME